MKPTLGWTMLSRAELRQAERLASGEQDTRDEIGFLLIHQGFADRFFPGTSVLHTRVRYALFVPWLFVPAREGSHATGPEPQWRDRASISRGGWSLGSPFDGIRRQAHAPGYSFQDAGSDDVKPKTACGDDTDRVSKPACVQISTFLHARRQLERFISAT